MKCLSPASAGFGWATVIPSPELLQCPPGAPGAHPNPATPNLEQSGLRCSKGWTGQVVEIGCPGGSHLKINAFPGCKQRSPLQGRGLCFQAPAEHEHRCCPPGAPLAAAVLGRPPQFEPAWQRRAVVTHHQQSRRAERSQAPLHPTLLVPGGILEISHLQKSSGRIKSSGEHGH